MSQEFSLREFYEALSALCEGVASGEQLALLEASLREDAALRDLYLTYLEVHAQLQWRQPQEALDAVGIAEQSGMPILPAGRTAEPSVAPQSGSAWRRFVTVVNQPRVFALTFATSFLFGGLMLLGLLRIDTTASTKYFTPPASSEAAPSRLVGAWNCVWREPAQGNEEHWWELESGLAQLRFASGAEVLLEGPARFRVDSAASGTLEFGRLAARVPPRGRGFSVQTPQVKVTDLGTEFGVGVDRDGVTEVHVFSGEVATEWRDGRAEPPRSLSENQAVRFVSTTRESRALAADAGRFVRQLPLSSPETLPISPEYVTEVKNSAPLAYWRFEELENHFRVRDEVGENHLTARGLIYLNGGEANRVLDLKVGASLITESPLRGLGGGNYSIELWCRPTHPAESAILALQTASSEMNWQDTALLGTTERLRPGDPPYVLRGLHRWPPGSSSHRGANLWRRIYPNVWTHVVLVKQDRQVQLFCQGEQVDARTDATQLGGELHRVTVGSLDNPKPSRGFQGQIDEAAIYARALSTREIARHFNTVKLPNLAEPPSP